MSEKIFEFDTACYLYGTNTDTIKGVDGYINKNNCVLHFGTFDDDDRFYMSMSINRKNKNDYERILRYESDIDKKYGFFNENIVVSNESFYNEEVTDDTIYTALLTAEAYNNQNIKQLIDMAYELITYLHHTHNFETIKLNNGMIKLNG